MLQCLRGEDGKGQLLLLKIQENCTWNFHLRHYILNDLCARTDPSKYHHLDFHGLELDQYGLHDQRKLQGKAHQDITQHFKLCQVLFLPCHRSQRHRTLCYDRNRGKQ